MHAERTPNPNSIKWVLGQAVAGDQASASFYNGEVVGRGEGEGRGDGGDPTPEVSPLAAGVLAVEGTESVFLGPTFVTVTKAEAFEWTDLAAPIVAAIKEWAASGAPALGPEFVQPEEQESSVVIDQIRTILERDVRPYVESDGGEIQFAGYRDGVVEVILQGACAGCPSSSITLKMGIEARLKEEIPEVKSVVAL